MSSASVIQRSADGSAFVSNLKNRGSSTNPNAISVLYKSEVNTALCCKSKVVASPNTSIGYDRLVQIELQNFDHLQKIFLKTTFGARGQGTPSSASNAVALRDWIGAYVGREFRLVYNGVVLARLTPTYLVARAMKEAGRGEKTAIQNLMGGFHTLASGSYVDTDTAGTLDSQSAEGRSGLSQEVYCELPFWFSEKSSLALDCGILHGRLILEIDVDTLANCHNVITTAGQGCPLTNMEVIQYSCSLHPRQEEEYRALSYSPKQPLTQIGYDITEFTESNLTHATATKHVIKLNSITGYVQKLWVVARSDTDSAINFKNYSMKSCVLKAMGSEIYKCEDLDKHENDLEAWVNGDLHTTLTGNQTILPNSHIDSNSIFCMNFKDVHGSKHRSACNGGISFAGLSVPELEITVAVANESQNGQELGTGDSKLTIIAECYNMVVYSTNGNGATSIKTLKQ